MKKIYKILACFITLVMASHISWGQEILTFEFSALAGSEVTTNSNYNDAGLTTSTISRGSGLTASNNGGRFNATNWAITSITNAVSGNDYMEFTIIPNSGKQFSVSSIVVQWQRSGTGNTQIALRSSVDNYASNLDAVNSVTDNTTTQTFTWTFAQANSSTAVTYRFYSYAEGTSGTGGPGDGAGNDIAVNGSVSDIVIAIVNGCTDPLATNYNALATVDDGSCSFIIAVYGCTDSTAFNYNVSANTDDGSCGYSVYISEYAEGSSYNKYIEIYNGTSQAIDLSNYKIWTITNGGSWPENILSLSGMLLAGDAYVVASNNVSVDPTILTQTDITWSQASWTGDDAVGLVRNGVLVDVIGTDGPDIGDGWLISGVSNATKDHTLVRKCGINQGNTNWALSAGTTAQNSEWLVRNINDWTNLAQHTISCSGSYSYGCLDTLASNYDASVNGHDGSCTYPGCTDPLADNYSFLFSTVDGTLNPPVLAYLNGNAVDNGSCLYYGCMDVTALNYDSSANINEVSVSDSSNPCVYLCDPYVATSSVVTPPSCNGAFDGSATAYIAGSFGNDFWLWSDGQTSSTAVGLAAGTYTCTITDSVNGCSATTSIVIGDPLVLSITATTSDVFPGQTNGSVDITVSGGSPCLNSPTYTYAWSDGSTNEDISGLALGPIGVIVTDCNGCTVSWQGFILINIIYGCIDSTATNYNPSANSDDGSCFHEGCMDSLAVNYDAIADVADNSCCYVSGCTDSLAFNYDTLACFDDNSCIAVLLGCTDANALNYNALANVDDGSCIAKLFFSEYAEGSSNNKYFEIYNPTSNTVDLSAYAFPNVSNAPTHLVFMNSGILFLQEPKS